MTEPSDLLAAFSASLRSTIDPIKQELDKIEQEIATREAELVELRKLRTQAQRLVNTFNPDNKPKTKSKAGSAGLVSQERMAEMTAWLRNQYGPDDEIVASLVVSDGLGWAYSSTVNGLKAAADQGVLRLDRVGNRRTKIYKLVAQR